MPLEIEATTATIKPLADKVVLTPLEKKEKFDNSVLVRPDTVDEKSAIARVVAVGPGLVNEKTGERIPIEVKPGQTVVYSKYAGTELKHQGTLHLVVAAKDVLAVLED